ncbi:MAG: hypothetical protein KDD14_19340, partial [Saprospiraceae bacterium]|nr:hypothetical protein [Saprospiraceae bacterium]
MKYPLQLIFLALLPLFNFHAPSEPPEIVIPSGAQLKQLKLEGMNTILQIYLPAAMDSFAHWDADCCTGGLDAYAYWHNTFPHVESNLGLCFPKYYPDSIFQITVLVQLKPDTIATWLEASLDAKSIFQKKYNEAYNTDIDWKLDTLE